jgi:hypothetical protein
MTGIKRLVLDVLIPIKMPSAQIAVKLSEIKGVEGVDVLIQEVERRVETAKITIEGENLDYDDVKTVLDKTGVSLQSIDRITCGKRIVG